MTQWIAIAAGGAVGAIARHLVANGVYAWLGREFPHGTLFVNVSGSFLMGLLTELMLQRYALSVEYRAAILVGFLGAYTTFSTFSLETLYLFEAGAVLKAFLNVFLSVALCLAAVWIGLILGRALFSGDIYPWLGHGLPYAGLGAGLALAFALATAAECLAQRMALTAELRAAALITLLGLYTTASTLWLAFRLPDIRPEFHGLSSLFAVNALFGAAATWLGVSAGDWLWRLVPLR